MAKLNKNRHISDVTENKGIFGITEAIEMVDFPEQDPF